MKYIYSPILTAVAIGLIILAAAPFVRDRETDPILRVVGPWVGIYSALGGIAIVVVVAFAWWKMRS